MERHVSIDSPHNYKKPTKPFLRENRKIIIQFIFTLFFFAIGIWFIKHEGAELFEVRNVLNAAKWQWVLIGIAMTALYIFLQGQMYVYAFASSLCKVSLIDSTLLFIKRNLISIFLPAGGISSLAFFTGTIESKEIRKTQIHFASSIYGFVGILTVVIVAVPIFIYAIIKGTIGNGEWYALAAVILLMSALLIIFRSITQKRVLYNLLVRLSPAAEVFLNSGHLCFQESWPLFQN